MIFYFPSASQTGKSQTITFLLLHVVKIGYGVLQTGWTPKDKCDVLRLCAYENAKTKERGIILTKCFKLNFLS